MQKTVCVGRDLETPVGCATVPRRARTHRLVYHSTLGLRVIKKKKKMRGDLDAPVSEEGPAVLSSSRFFTTKPTSPGKWLKNGAGTSLYFDRRTPNKGLCHLRSRNIGSKSTFGIPASE